MMKIGLSLNEFVALRIEPPAGADQAFQRAAEMEREQMFPTSLVAAYNRLGVAGLRPSGNA